MFNSRVGIYRKMKKMIIRGGQKLSGEVTIGGAKNSTVALIPAAILADTPVTFDSVPDILDVHNLMLILKSMNVTSTFNHGELSVDPTKIKKSSASWRSNQKSSCFLLLYGCASRTLRGSNCRFSRRR